MSKTLFYEVGELTFDEQVRQLVNECVQTEVEAIFATGRLWLDLDDDKVSFDFTDSEFECRKSFRMSAISFCGVEDDKDAVIAALEALIQRVKDHSTE